MNILGIGGWELALIVLIMLVVAGPKRMLQWAYILGKYLGQLRILWGQLMTGVQKELDDAGVDLQLPKDIPTRGDINRVARDALRPMTEPVEQTIREYEKEHQAIASSVGRGRGRANGNGVTPTAEAEATNNKSTYQSATSPDKPKSTDAPTSTPNKDAENTSNNSNFGTWSGVNTNPKQE